MIDFPSQLHSVNGVTRSDLTIIRWSPTTRWWRECSGGADASGGHILAGDALRHALGPLCLGNGDIINNIENEKKQQQQQ